MFRNFQLNILRCSPDIADKCNLIPLHCTNHVGRKGHGRGMEYLYFLSLKKHTRTFNFRLNEPSLNILGPLVRFDHPWKKIYTHPGSFFWQNNRKFHILKWELETSTVGFSDVLNLIVWFLRGFFDFKGVCFPPFSKIRPIFSDLCPLMDKTKLNDSYIFKINIISLSFDLIYKNFVF